MKKPYLHLRKTLLQIAATRVFQICTILFSFGLLHTANAQSTQSFSSGSNSLVVYDSIPGLGPGISETVPNVDSTDTSSAIRVVSDKYRIRVRSVATNYEWVDVFTHYTYNRGAEIALLPQIETGTPHSTNTQHYPNFTRGWSHTYGNIEMSPNQPVEVEISAKNNFTIENLPFYKAAIHPAHKASSPIIADKKVYFTISNPAQVTIDINGQMDDHNELINPIGHPTHTVSLFANPLIQKPPLNNSRTFYVTNGAMPAPEVRDTYDTLYFMPGVHDIGLDNKIYPGKNYYIPGDALVLGAFNNLGVDKQLFSTIGSRINFSGYGTISGVRTRHPLYIPNSGDHDYYKPIMIDKAEDYEIFGITVVDPANHSVFIPSGKRGAVRWAKTIGWRANSDGFAGNDNVDDCFMRTSDDSSYVRGNRKRCIFWKDHISATFYMSFIPSSPLLIEDCDVIYLRSRDSSGRNGGLFNCRGDAKNGTTQTSGALPTNVTFRNFRVHDRRSNMSIFNMRSFTGNDSGNNIPVENVGCSYSNIKFENITIAKSLVSQFLLGCTQSPWNPGALTFDNVTFEGALLTPANFNSIFVTNSHVGNQTFLTSSISVTSVVLNGSLITPLVANQTTQLTATVLPANANNLNVTWSSSNPTVATVDANGLVSAISPGTTTITVTTQDGSKTALRNISVTGTSGPGQNVLLVVNDASALNASDAAIRSRLEQLGYNVVVITASASATSDANNKRLVIISSTVTSGSVGTKFRDVNVPVINWETALQDEFLFTTGPGQGTATSQSGLNLVNAGHPLAAGLANGSRQVMTGTTTSGFSWGQAGGNPIIIARLNAAAPNDHPCIYAYELGSAMLTGIAPARRVHLFLQNDTYVNLNSDGRSLFDAAVSWAAATPTFALSTNATNGSITLNPPGGTYAVGTSVEVNAVAAPNYRLSGWTGDLSGSATPQNLIINSNKAVTAQFIRTYTLTANAGTGGSITPPSGSTHDENSIVNLTAIPNPGYRFASWSGDLTGQNASTTLTMDGDKTVTANFVQEHTLITIAGTGGSVTPVSGTKYDNGTLVSVSATPAPGYQFVNWSGASNSSSPSINVLMDADKSVTANFSLLAVTENSWTGTTNGAWNEASNWSPSSIPTSGAALTFGGSPANQPTNQNLSDLTPGAINFTNSAPFSTSPPVPGFTLGAADLSQTITLGGNITTTAPLTGTSTFSDTINLNLVLNADRTITTSRNPTAALNHNLTINGVISGAFQLTKGNSGADLILSNPANSFTGPMNITGGNLFASFLDVSGNNSSIGSGSVINLANGQLYFTGSVTPSGPINRSINLTDIGSSGGGIYNNGSVALRFNGALSNVTSTGNKNFTLGGNNSGSNVFESTLINSPGGQVLSFTKAESGTWTLTGPNTYTGQTQVNNGTINVLTIADSVSSSIGLFQGNGSTAGLRIGNANSTGNITVASTGNGGNTNRTVQIGNGTGSGGARITNNSSSGALVFGAADFNFQTATTLNRTVFIGGSNGSSNQITGIIRDNTGVGATVSITKEGAGRWILAGNNQYSGPTAATAGVLQLNHNSALPTASPLTINGGIIGLGADNFTRSLATTPTSNQVTIIGSNSGFAAYGANRSVNLGGISSMLTWGSGGFFNLGQNSMVLGHSTATHTLTFQNPIDLNGTSRTLQVDDGAADVDAILTGGITNSTGTAGLAKVGSGTLVLSGTHSYTGTTELNAGTLSLLGGNHASPMTVQTGASISFTLGSPATSTASLNLTNGKVKVTGTPTPGSHLLMSASSIIGTPILDGEIPGYELVRANGNTELRLNSIPPADPYLAWAGPGVDFDEDTNNDGIKNGLAWLLGATNPTANSSGLLPIVSQTGGSLKMTFKMLPASVRAGAQLFVEHSSDLGGNDLWSTGVLVPDTTGGTLPVTFIVTDRDLAYPDNMLDVEANISKSEAHEGRLFSRLRAVR